MVFNPDENGGGTVVLTVEDLDDTRDYLLEQAKKVDKLANLRVALGNLDDYEPVALVRFYRRQTNAPTDFDVPIALLLPALYDYRDELEAEFVNDLTALMHTRPFRKEA